MIKPLFLILCLVFGSSVISAEDGLVAIVNNEAITQKDLSNFINFMRIQMSAQYSKEEVEQRINQMRPDLIQRLIEDRLILQAAYKEDIIINENRIKARVQQMRKNYLTEADFQNALAAQGLNLADVELKIKEQLLMMEIIDRKIRAGIVLKPQEITDYYNAHSQGLQKPEERLVRFITIKDPKLARQIQETIAEYKDLDAISRSYSLEITDLGWVASEQLKPEIAKAVFNLEAGKISPFLDSDRNLYIFEVKAIRPPGKAPLSDVQGEISNFLFERKMQEALAEWLEELKSEAYIEIKGNYGAG